MLTILQIISYVRKYWSHFGLARIPQNRNGWMFCGVSMQHDVECQNGHSQSILIESDAAVYQALNESPSSSDCHH